MPHVMGLSEWDDWAGLSLAKNNATNVSFSIHDKKFLLHVLVHLKIARIIHRANHNSLDVVVLSSKPLTNFDDKAIPENLRIPVTLWDIKNAENKIEQKLQELSAQATECTKTALKLKKRNQINLAKTQLSKRKLIQKRIDSDSMIQMKLLQTKNAIESAQTNRLTIDLIADSAKLLRHLREQTTIDEVDGAMDDLQDEIDSLKDMNSTLTSLGSNVNDMGTEDDLLEELERLMIDDNAKLAPVADIPLSKTSAQDTILLKNDNITVSREKQTVSNSCLEKDPEYA
mmetsp:Transcript_11373/g.27243  ORF Transcript_11373/g.27243 Transcript_11373/m.27243 type:complete len:286 (-) Transcript_11373:790-1647(-)